VFFWHSAKNVFVECFFALGKAASLPSVFYLALGKELLCRVPEKKHSANHMALGKEPDSGSAWLFSTIANIANHDQVSTYIAGDRKSPTSTGLSMAKHSTTYSY
jgi:hypothetical protein